MKFRRRRKGGVEIYGGGKLRFKSRSEMLTVGNTCVCASDFWEKRKIFVLRGEKSLSLSLSF